ncbi:MAG: hypothetical protein AAGC64_13775 [Bacteroidota bacterium]
MKKIMIKTRKYFFITLKRFAFIALTAKVLAKTNKLTSHRDILEI